MHESFDAFEYVDYLRDRWRVVAIACAAAILISLVVSLLLPKRFTATATIIIEPPGGNDVRTATAVSPMYLESLRTYERFATSDTLFLRAAERFHLAGASSSIESQKRRILKVSKLRDTKILEISATLPDPKVAQGFVQYVADQTVSMSREENVAADRDTVTEAEKQAAESGDQLKRAQAAWTATATEEPVDGLQAEIDADTDLIARLNQDLVDAQAEVAEYQDRQKQSTDSFDVQQLGAARARASVLAKRTQELERSIAEKSAILSRRSARREALQAALKMAQAALESADTHLREVRAAAGARGERLRVIDPGIVPQRPSSPNISLNVVAALFLAFVASVVYVSFGFAYRRRTVAFNPPVKRGLRA
ncbi:MAG: Wzz/FepE/Etk N-terminal domain-containing protein [Bryobacteraceae bacterium]